MGWKEFLIIPIVFGFEAASTALIGINIGANKLKRALNIGWVATLYIFVGGLFLQFLGIYIFQCTY